jgi:histidine ammonia-lyase
MQSLVLSGEGLSIEDVAHSAGISRDGREISPVKISLSENGKQKIEHSRDVLERIEARGDYVYGVSTGFGALKSELISPEHRAKLQENLIRSHSAGVGEYLHKTDVRAAMTVLAGCLSRGKSGIPLDVVECLIAFLNADAIPFVPSRGSLGASGDLAPLAHIALALMGESVTTSTPPSEKIKMASKVGLSLINGTHVHVGIGALLVYQAELLAKLADIACGMHVDAMLCSSQPFREDVHALRPHEGGSTSAKNIRKIIEESELILSHANCSEVQDAYSVRCAAQVHGASRNAIQHLREVITTELASVTDNPLVLDDEIVSAGHFHGEPVALALDYFKIGLAELASISERRIERTLNKDTNRGLPAFLAQNPGLQSGLMLLQYTSAALVSENKVLCHPSSVDSIPTGANQEDHVSMAMNSALHAKQVLKNVRAVLVIELIVNAQALDCRRQLQEHKPGRGVQSAWDAIRQNVKVLDNDRVMTEEIQSLPLGDIVNAVENAVGALL